MDKINVFEKEYEYLKNTNNIKDIKYLVSILPDYFFTIPASSTGKYHPSFALGDGGLVRHTKVAVRLAYELLKNETTGSKFTDNEKDLIIMALILHDGVKKGIPESEHTKTDHPLLVSKLIMENKSKLKLKIDDIRLLCNIIESHMGEWNIDNYTKKEVLPKPTSEIQKFVHMCDFLASKKFIDVLFDENNNIKGV